MGVRTTLSCDSEDARHHVCPRTFSTAEATATMARERARRWGWTWTEARGDRCPTHRSAA
jgi:hypothetical protein